MYRTKVLFVLLLLSSTVYAVDSGSCANYDSTNDKCYYDASIAVSYVNTYVNDIPGYNVYFPDYTGSGGNCTNFVNQAILAGFVGSTDPATIYSKRGQYQVDRYSTYKWFYDYPQLSASWKDASDLYDYAVANSPVNYKGLHFQYITSDSPTQALTFSLIQVGDVVFADWTGDGTIDHTMMVVRKSANNYGGVGVSYQNAEGYNAQSNISLSAINTQNTVFLVYRPTTYNDQGL
jgi:hypothetical protein